ncbi:MAG: sensor histidine kinase [Crocinitomicaceae bacterium]
MDEFLSQDVLFPIIFGTTVFAVLIIFIILFIVNYQKKQKEFEAEREEFKRALLQTQIEIKEQTLTNISRELHDNIGQIASLIKINLNLLSTDLSAEDKLKVTDSIELSRRLIKDVKALSVSLKSKNLERYGLLKMLENDIERYKAVGNLTIQFTHTRPFPSLKSDTEIILYRMSQEIFNNILKHSQASEVSVHIVNENSRTVFNFTDNGVGFKEESVEKGSGLLNLAERCAMIGAELSIQAADNRGTNIKITL